MLSLSTDGARGVQRHNLHRSVVNAHLLPLHFLHVPFLAGAATIPVLLRRVHLLHDCGFLRQVLGGIEREGEHETALGRLSFFACPSVCNFHLLHQVLQGLLLVLCLVTPLLHLVEILVDHFVDHGESLPG